MSQHVEFEIIVTYAMIEYIFELTTNETAISTLISLTSHDDSYILLMYIIIVLFFF